jgi:dihydrolipoamide dehydrogenase
MTTGEQAFDVVVLGGGAVGENAAQYAIEGTDLTAVIVERELVGGECSYYACVPSKVLLRPVEVAAISRSGLGTVPTHVDVPAALRRRDRWVSGYDDSSQVEWAGTEGIEVVRGHGRLVDERLVEVEYHGDTTRIRARHAIILATGSEPDVPQLYADAHPWGSRDATGVVEVPGRLVIVGGGVVACEAATWMQGLGSAVTMLVRGGALLEREERLASQAVLEGLRDAGCDVRLSTSVAGVERERAGDTGLGRLHGGPVALHTSSGEVRADELLVATGRRPRLDHLGLASVGLTPGDVLDGQRNPSWLHVLGDASGDAALTHWGKYRARVVGARIAARATGGEPPWEADGVPVPQVIYTDPEVATVGMTERAAGEAGHEVVVAEVSADAVSGTSLLREQPRGGARLVVAAHSGRLLGATFVGPGSAELLHSATVAIVGSVPVHALRHAVPSFPTASELWLRLLESLPREYRSPR